MQTTTSQLNAVRSGAMDTGSEWRCAELAARIGLESELAARYSADPAAVLDEFCLGGAREETETLLESDPGFCVDNLTAPEPGSVVMFTVTVAPESSPNERPLAA